MGFLPPGNVIGSTMLQKGPGNISTQGIAGTGGEFAVREGPGAPFPELNVGVQVQRTALFKGLHSRHTLFQGRAPFQH